MVLAGFIFIKTRPAAVPANAAIIRIVSSNDVDGVRDALGRDASQISAVDLDGNTPLHIAARGGYGEMVDALIAAGADVNLPNRAGWTPLASALLSHEKNQLSIVKALIAAGASANTSTVDGTSLRQLAKALPGVDPRVVTAIARDSNSAPDSQASAGHVDGPYASADDRK